ncbi:MAG: nucleotidyltransferase domain-containing protein [Longimicrobiales bacterium]
MDSLAGTLERIAQRYHIRDIYVFGSRAAEISRRVAGQESDAPRSASDVDMGVQPVRGRRLDAPDRVRLAIEFEDLFGASRVDLVVLAEARPFLAVDVVRGELLYSADLRAQAEQELYILRRAGDLASFQRERVHQILTGGGR